MKQQYDIEGMTCSSCQLTIENSIKKLGVDSVNVSLLTNTMEVDSEIDEEKIIDAVDKVGYKAISRKSSLESKTSKKNPQEIFIGQLNELRNILLVSIPLMIILMYIAMGDMIGLQKPSFLQGYSGAGNFALSQLILTIPVVYVNRRYFKSGFRALFKGHPNMDSLIALGSGAGLVYGLFAMIMINHGLGTGDQNMVKHFSHDLYFEASAMILTLISLGKYLETKSKVKTTAAIDKLIEMQPTSVILIKNKLEKRVPIETIQVGDRIKILPGERLALDGFLVEGGSSLDTSPVTGESLPVEVKTGDKLISGSINNTGSFIMEADKVGENTTISQIIKLMEKASSTKAPISTLADKISSIFVPAVIIISILSFTAWMIFGYSFTFAFSIAIGILVISCPCALGLATPIAMMVANGKAAEHGILVKNAEGLEILNQVDTIFFDKTGTITKGDPVLTDIAIIEEIDPNKVLEIAYSLESQSQHPLAQAIIKYAKEKNADLLRVENFNSSTGMGIQASINGTMYYMGNDKLIDKLEIDRQYLNEFKIKYNKQGKTSIYLADEDRILAVFAIADSVKKTSIDALKIISELGIESVMLTGDNKETASEISKQVGIEKYEANLLPQDKDKIISNVQKEGKKVAMVGDGINDAPSLMRADVGIAIGAGSDIAIESADLVLIKSNLQDLVSSINLSKATIKVIKQNLFYAFFYNVIAIPLAMGVFYPSFGIKLNPMVAALAMSLSSIFVVFNSLRLNSFKIDNKSLKEGENKYFEVKYDKIKIKKSNKIKEESHMKVKTLDIKGMSCSHCANLIKKALEDFSTDVEVSFKNNSAKIRVSDYILDDQLKEAVASVGYELVGISDEG